jgi:XTP/dITP diphosphohydrolase
LNQLLLATENPGKVLEMMALLEDLPVRLVTPLDLGLRLRVVEDGSTYAENASRKALAHARASGLVSLGDDSGLEVEALNGQPGLHSHRFLPGKHVTDADRRAYLLSLLKDVPQPWNAAFHCTVAVAEPDGSLLYARGECRGEIIPCERGSNGFGYDPIFLMDGMQKTMAELEMAEKNLVSHRARAVIAARPILAKLFGLSLKTSE